MILKRKQTKFHNVKRDIIKKKEVGQTFGSRSVCRLANAKVSVRGSKEHDVVDSNTNVLSLVLNEPTIYTQEANDELQLGIRADGGIF